MLLNFHWWSLAQLALDQPIKDYRHNGKTKFKKSSLNLLWLRRKFGSHQKRLHWFQPYFFSEIFSRLSAYVRTNQRVPTGTPEKHDGHHNGQQCDTLSVLYFGNAVIFHLHFFIEALAPIWSLSGLAVGLRSRCVSPWH